MSVDEHTVGFNHVIGALFIADSLTSDIHVQYGVAGIIVT